MHILIVDDEPGNIKILTIFLHGLGYTVTSASSGREALGLTSQLNPDLILLDLMMPEMSGIDVSRILGETPGFSTPIIFLSANTQKEAALSALTSGGFDYLTKPFDFDMLSKKIEIALNYRRTVAPHHNLQLLLTKAAKDNSESLVLNIRVAQADQLHSLFGEAVARQATEYVKKRMELSLPSGSYVYLHQQGELIAVVPANQHTLVAETLGDHLVRDMAIEPFHVPGASDLYLHLHVGGTWFPAYGDQAEVLFQQARLACSLCAENPDVSSVIYQAGIDNDARESLRLESELHGALQRGELTVHYQPKQDADSHKIIGVEALVRWCRSDGTMVPPTVFIPIAEKCGMIGPIGEWVLQSACQTIAKLNSETSQELSLAVNLSVMQFSYQDVYSLVENALQESGLQPHYLELEITESILAQQSVHILDSLGRLRLLGIRIAIDDFGTGFSSLSYLQNLPIDVLKVDRSFISPLTYGQKSVDIVSTIITLGHSLHLRIVAEGVETRQQLQILEQYRCEEIQGYLISKPLPIHDLYDFLKNEPDLMYIN